MRFGLQDEAAEHEVYERVLPVLYRDGDQKRERPWAEVVKLVIVVDLDDFGVRGPRTLKWCLDFLAHQQQHPEDYHVS